MSKAKHTPEPWEMCGNEALDENDRILFAVVPALLDEYQRGRERNIATYPEQRNAIARAVSCVNACAGIPHPEKIRGLVETAEKLLAATRAQFGDKLTETQQSTAKRLRSALRAVKGERQ